VESLTVCNRSCSWKWHCCAALSTCTMPLCHLEWADVLVPVGCLFLSSFWTSLGGAGFLGSSLVLSRLAKKLHWVTAKMMFEWKDRANRSQTQCRLCWLAEFSSHSEMKTSTVEDGSQHFSSRLVHMCTSLHHCKEGLNVIQIIISPHFGTLAPCFKFIYWHFFETE